jgi:hypothetical protein
MFKICGRQEDLNIPCRLQKKNGNTGSVYKVINMFSLSAVDSYREHPFAWVVTQKLAGIL